MNSKMNRKIEDFFSHYLLQNFVKGDVIISPDRQTSSAYCLKTGVVRLFAYSQSGQELTLNLFKPLSFFPVAEIINDGKNTYYFDALTDGEVYIAPKTEVLKWLKDNPDVVFDLLQRIYHGLDGFFLRLESLLSGEAANKTLVQMMILTQRFKNELTLTHAQIASLTGLTRETVTRELAKLKKNGYRL